MSENAFTYRDKGKGKKIKFSKTSYLSVKILKITSTDKNVILKDLQNFINFLGQW